MTDYRTFDAYGREVTPADVQARLGGSLQHVLARQGTAPRRPTPRELAAELTASGTLDYPASPTPVADALAVVDANRAELLRVLRSALGECGEGDVSSERDAYLSALENLAGAARSHGIGHAPPF